MVADPFVLKVPQAEPAAYKQPIVRLKPSYYQALTTLKAKTGLTLGAIVEQCIDYALAHMEPEREEADQE